MCKYISKKWKRSRNKFTQLTIIALALFIGLGVVEFPISSEKNVVHAASSSNAGFSLWSNFNVSSLSANNSQAGDSLYWGSKNGNSGNPMEWHIISSNQQIYTTESGRNGLLLFYKGDFGASNFRDFDSRINPDYRLGHHHYSGSKVETKLNDCMNLSLSEKEKLVTSKSSRDAKFKTVGSSFVDKNEDNAFEKINGNKWFAPSMSMFKIVNTIPESRAAGFAFDEGNSKYYWTSTSSKTSVNNTADPGFPILKYEEMVVVGGPKTNLNPNKFDFPFGTFNRLGQPVRSIVGGISGGTKREIYIRPATVIDVNVNNTLLITNASGAKPNSVGSTLTNVPSGNGAYKLTLKDTSQNLNIESVKMGKNNTATINYSKTGAGTSLSAIVTDSSNNVISYGRLKNISSGTENNQTAEIILPSNFREDNYKLQLFTEIYNGDNKTDYASNLTVGEIEYPKVDFSMNYIADGATEAKIYHTMEIPDAQFGKTISNPGNPTRKGFDFKGWFKDASCTDGNQWDFASYIIPIDQKGKLTLYAKWTVIDYSINYDLKPPGETNEQLSSITNPNTSIKGYQVITPEFKILTPTLKGYTFRGWTEKITVGGAESDKDNPLIGEAGVVNADKSITIKKGSVGNRQYEATWERDSHNVQIVPGDGTYDGSLKISNVLYKNEIKIGGITPPNGKKFVGWQLKQGSDALVSGDSEQGYTLRMGTNNVILAAIYEGIDYKLTFSTNGGSGAGKESEYKMGDLVTLPGADVAGTKNKSKLIGWNTEADGSGTHYNVGLGFTMPASNTTLYAQWKGSYTITYKISFLNGNTWENGSSNEDRYETDKDIYITPIDKKVSRLGYQHEGWTRIAGDSASKINDNTKLIEDITLFPIMVGLDYDVIFDPNGGEGTMTPQTIKFDKSAGLTKNEFEKKGYVFKGWTEDKEGNGTLYLDGTSYKMQTKGTILYAQWKVVDYSIEYDLSLPQGETGIIDNSINKSKTTYNAISAPFTIGVPTLTGYKFIGWTEEVTKGGDGTDKGDSLSGYNGVQNNDHTVTVKTGSIGNRKYKANWELNKYTLTLDLNGGKYSDSNIPMVITKPYKTKVSLIDPTPPIKKVFTGWMLIGNTPPGGGFGIGDEKNLYTMGAGNITIQAQYKDVNQSIQFTAETETKLKDNTYAYGEEFEVEAEAIEVEGHLPDKTKGIEFSTQDTDYLEIVGAPTWNPSTFKAKATFKVVKPLPEGVTNTLTIEINKPETDTHHAALQVSSTNVKTEKRQIDLKIDPTIFVANKGKHRISLKAGEVMPDITHPPKIYRNGETTEDLVAIEDQKNNKIPYITKTSHWLGNYTGLNGMNKDDVLIEDGKVSQKIAGNIWKLNIVEDTNSKEIAWFKERYEVIEKSPIDAIVDVYDITGNSSTTTPEILYANNIAMSLKDYENKLATVTNIKQAIINESNFKVTNMVAPYKEIKVTVDSMDNIIRIIKADSHAGVYEVQYSLESGSDLRATLIVADTITKNIVADEELRANTYIHQKGETLRSEGAQGFLTLMKTEVIDLKTGKKKENMKFDVAIDNPDVWKELGESTMSLKTDAGTEVTSKIIVRDHAVTTNEIRVSANDLALSRDEATALVNELNGKNAKEQVSILTPTDPESKYKMYPYATNYVTGNRVLISSITGLPDIFTSTGKVEAGVYDVTFETDGGGTVTAQIKVRTADPTAYVEIPAKIKLKKSNESNVVAEETEEVKLKTGMGVELDALKETILVETPSSFVLKGISPSNTTTELNVDVYIHGENGETKHDRIVPFATLDSKNTTRKYTLRIAKTLPKHRKDLYIGKMDFAISFGKAVSEGGG